MTFEFIRSPAYRGNGVGRAWNIARYLQQLWWMTPELAADFKPDAVIASSTYPMDIWIARRIVQRARAAGRDCQLVYEVHDLWPLSPMELFDMPRWHPFIVLCQRAEDTAYRDADAVVSMLLGGVCATAIGVPHVAEAVQYRRALTP
mgnify:CR=1 FL=1